MNGAQNRLRIGIVFSFSKNWLGGVYYIVNLINALHFLDPDEQPELIVFFSEELSDHVAQIEYPHLALVKVDWGNVYWMYLQSWLTGKNRVMDQLLKVHHLNALYPLNDQPVSTRGNPNMIAAWFPDLQHKFYPAFFSKTQWWLREIRLRILLRNTAILVVSSDDVASHFRRFYKLRTDLKISVLRFASVIDEDKLGLLEEMKIRYNLPKEYFIVSNQFHNHKNHRVVFEALAFLKANGIFINLVVTGRFENKGNEKYIIDLKHIIQENRLEDQIHFLGVIPRTDQLTIMKNSIAVLQPSLFEGWSTVIEDAMALQVPVIASNLPVNNEQLAEHGFYFDPHNAQSLATHMRSFLTNRPVVAYEPNPDRIKRFAKEFIRLFE
ncbi:MAG: glycosyltransferase family 4 protein [Cyclobacteriaceae bacterium]|nr:glycosyltransferase family 4 protein [Cyclobacteriaceae bacterium]